MTGAPAPEPAITVEELEVVYQRGAEPAVSDISFTLAAGDALLFTGGRGSGKTSILRALLGLVVFQGSIAISGFTPGDPRILPHIGYAPQGRGFAETLSARQLGRTVATLRTGSGDAAAVETALDAAGFPEDRRNAHDLNVEELRRLALACALIATPRILVLDDPWEFPETVAAIERTRAAGGIVVAASYEPGGLPDLFGETRELTGVTDADDTEDDEADGEEGDVTDAADDDVAAPAEDADAVSATDEEERS